MVFRDPNTLYKVDEEVGSVSSMMPSHAAIEISGTVRPQSVKIHNLTAVILIDGADRFITGVELTSEGKWSTAVSAQELGNDNSALKVQAFAASGSSDFVFPLRVEPPAAEIYSSFVKEFLPADSEDIPSFRDKFLDLIVEATKTPYVARSVCEGIKTGNNYQTLNLGQIERLGGRRSREKFLSEIDFRGKTVLDIGANTGENSRIARRLGASLVDGYEYDPFFVEIGRAINAVAGMTRVSIFQGDCTRPELFAGMKYDLVIALSVWVYLKDTIREVAEITDTMIFETHTLDHGIDFYYSSILRHFPSGIALGLTDKPEDPHQSRMFVVFSKNRQKLEQLVRREFLSIKPYFSNKFIESYGPLNRVGIHKLANGCLEKHKNRTSYAIDHYKYGGEIYFEVFLAGFAQYVNSQRRVDSQNVYVEFLKKGIEAGQIDPGLAKIAENDGWLARKVGNKYEDALNIMDGNLDLVAPIEVVPDPNGLLSLTTDSGENIRCDRLDGHHRLFMCELAGAERVHFVRNTGAAGENHRFSQRIASNYSLEVRRESSLSDLVCP